MVQHISELVNRHEKDIFLFLLVALVIIGGAGGAALLRENRNITGVSIEKNAFNVPDALGAAVKNFVASKNGAKYYPAGCASANRIKDGNKLFFASAADAISAGFERASACR